MRTKKKTKLLHEGRYVAEVEVELIVDETEWSPYLPVEEAYKLDKVREALKREFTSEFIDELASEGAI